MSGQLTRRSNRALWQKVMHDDALLEAFDKRICRNALDPRAFSLLITYGGVLVLQSAASQLSEKDA
jgi:hypothetical protein